MCGIAGLFDATGDRATEAAAATMSARLAHRGPDDQGVEKTGPVVLASRRLAVIDPTAAGHQPMASARGNHRLVFNGEIYNFLDLRGDLERRGHAFRTQSDSEVILSAYAEWGSACFERLWGMFAIAIWDADRQVLVLARDRLGKKPLHYAVDGGVFAFASEVRALLALPFVSRELDPDAVADYFAYGYVGAPRSVFRSIRKVMPGHVLAVSAAGIEERRYWELPEAASGEMSEGEAAEALRPLIADAVRRRMVSDVPLGAFLSGGIDSSLVVAYMAQSSPRPVRTFSVTYADPTLDESAEAREVANRLGTDHQEIPFDALEPSSILETLAYLDEPLGDPAAVPMSILSMAARRHVTVALSGDGGDELFAGYDQYAQPPRVPSAARNLVGAAGRALPVGVPGARRMRSAPIVDPVELHVQQATVFDRRQRARLMHGGEVGEGPEAERRRSAGCHAGESALARMRRMDLAHYLPDDILVKVDRMSMRHSLEVRSPLLDHRVAEFALGLPDALLMRSGRGKVLLRRLLQDFLPPSLSERPKRGFGIPVSELLRGALGPTFEAHVLAGRFAARGFIDPGVARRLFRAHRLGLRDNSRMLWNLLAFAVWFEVNAEA